MRTALSHPDRPASDVADALLASGFELSAPQATTRSVLDTFDGRLHEAGLRLEHDLVPESALVLRAGDDAPPARLETVAAPTWPSDLPQGPFRSRLAEVSRERALLPLLTVHSTVRVGCRRDRRGKATSIVELHEDIAVDGRGDDEPQGWLAEVQSVTGHREDAELVVTRLMALGLRVQGPDVAAVLADRAGVSLAGHDSSPTVPLAPSDLALTGFRRVLLNLLSTAQVNLRGTIDDTDPEFLHDFRVAVRRTRSVLTKGQGVLPDDVRTSGREDFRWLGQVTGPPRDLDVYLLGWTSYTASLDPPERASLEVVRSALERRQRHAHQELSMALRGRRTTALLDGWERWLSDPDVQGDPSVLLGPAVTHRITRAHDKVLRDGRRITPTTPAERLHDLRKDTKNLRYLLECFGGLFDPKERRRCVGQLKALQDNLGEHQDAEVHLDQLRALAHDLHGTTGVDADVLLAMGRLSDHLARRRREEREAFAERFAAYDTKQNRRALEALLDQAVVR